MFKKEDFPTSWSQLTWQQLTEAWTVKQRFGGNPDVAAAAALLALGELRVTGQTAVSSDTGETVYTLTGSDGRQWTTTPRQLAHLAQQQLPWFAFPYGDQGDKEERDDSGHVTRERREGKPGYVNPVGDWRDALQLPAETLRVGRRHFQLPQVACVNLTWQQYRSLQAIVPQLFSDGISDHDALQLQAQFLAHMLAPRSLALFDTGGTSIRFRLHYEYPYDSTRADQLVTFWHRQLQRPTADPLRRPTPFRRIARRLTALVRSVARRPSSPTAPAAVTLQTGQAPVLFSICFQAYQTAVLHYEKVYPLLFSGDGKSDALRTALTGEVDTLNAIMKYQGYSDQQQVYDANLPIILGALNTMTKEAKEIERLNKEIKRK